MKKFILLLAASVLVLNSYAQTKITWASIQGKWQGFALELKGIVYYNWEKDSLSVSDSIRADLVKKGMDAKTINAVFRQQFEEITELSVQFNRDSTAQFIEDEEEPELTRYRVDEKNSVIHSVNDKGTDHIIKAEMIGDKLRLLMGGEGKNDELWVFLKKIKP
jgi:hypothetical protein